MKYFILSQEKNIPNTVKLYVKANSPNEPQTELLKEDKAKVKQVTMVEVESSADNFFPSVIEEPVYMISDMVKKVICMYTDEVVWKTAVLLDHGLKQQNIYWLPLVDKIDCLSEKATFKKDGYIENLIINNEKIGNNKIFRIAGIKEKILVINLDIVESVLRRFPDGMKIKEIESEV